KALEQPPLEAHRPTIERIRAEAKRLARAGGPSAGLSLGGMAALAYPDRIGLRRKGDAPRYLLSGGKGAVMPAGSALANSRLIVATDLDGDPREAAIRQAAPLPEDELRQLFPDRIVWQETVSWNRREGRVMARRQETLGALVLDDRPWPDAPDGALARAALEGLRLIGLPWAKPARRLCARIALARGEDWPEVTDAALLEQAEDWLLAHLARARTEADLRALDLTAPLLARLNWVQQATLDRLAPATFTTPMGRHAAIDYDGDHPSIEVRLQEMFGTTRHPTVGANRLPLRITLLSPAQRPVQTTLDLPGFWATSYADVRKDMRGQYPRHPWPEDPTIAEPTLRAKPRGT
ncbi:MAG: ATP-dependent helicase C-terminal domain-containing protein, partial [Paracoccaceae bacterium]